MLMDGIYPTSYCDQQCKSLTGGTWVSNSFIRNRGQTSFATQHYDEGWPDYLTNNTPATPLYVRVAPSQSNPQQQVFWINGWETPRLILTCNKKYQFNVVACGHPFYLTTDSKGGHGNKDNLSQIYPSDYFVSTITINPGLPSKFYYQCANHPNMGGEVIIKK